MASIRLFIVCFSLDALLILVSFSLISFFFPFFFHSFFLEGSRGYVVSNNVVVVFLIKQAYRCLWEREKLLFPFKLLSPGFNYIKNET